MTLKKPFNHEMISVIALASAIIALPFSMGLCHAGLIVLVLNWLLEGEWTKKWTAIKNNILLWPFLFFLFLHLGGLFYSDDITNGWFNIEKKLSFFLLPVVLSTVAIRSSYVSLLFKTFILSCFIAVMICLSTALVHAIQPTDLTPVFDYTNYENFKLLNPNRSIWWSHFSYNVLSSAIDIHPTYLGLYIVFSIALLFYFLSIEEQPVSTWQRRGMIALILLFSFFVALLSSRAVLVVYLVVCIGGLIKISNKKNYAAPTVIALVLIGTVASIFTNPVSRFRFAQEFRIAPLAIDSDKLYTTSSSIRFSLWWLGVNSINSSNWLVGNGTGDVTNTMGKTAAKYHMTNVINSNDPHNQFLYTFLALGITGLATLLTCLLLPFTQRSLSSSFLHRCFIIVIIIACLTESVFELQKGIVFFSLFYSLLVFHLQPSHFTQLKVSHV